jgi:hypothetical protein
MAHLQAALVATPLRAVESHEKMQQHYCSSNIVDSSKLLELPIRGLFFGN